MDWANVTGRELWDALREVDVLRAPRPIWEVCSGVSIPKNQTKWTSRLKCNGAGAGGGVRSSRADRARECVCVGGGGGSGSGRSGFVKGSRPCSRSPMTLCTVLSLQ